MYRVALFSFLKRLGTLYSKYFLLLIKHEIDELREWGFLLSNGVIVRLGN